MTEKNISFHLPVLGICLLAVLCVVGWEYQRLQAQNRIRLFFRNSERIISYVNPPEIDRQVPQNAIPDHLKTKIGNILFSIPGLEAHIAKKYRVNPFDRTHDMDLRRGVVTHPVPLKHRLGRPNAPTWFCFCAGPGETGPILEINTIHHAEGIYYRFISRPYDVSNGLWSEGYLFADSFGNQWGRLPRAYY